ncbi:g5013 [Coccomyxa elongata]
MPTTAVAIHAPIFKVNAKRTYSVQPTNNWNLAYCILLGIGKGKQFQMLRKALKVADDDGDDSSRMCLRWLLCHAILLGAEGPSFQVANVLSTLSTAQVAMAQSQSWANAAAMLLPEIYWPCMGVAAQYIAAIKEEPSFVFSRVEAYASSADLASEKRHVMCCLSFNGFCILTCSLTSPSMMTAVLLYLE